MKSIAVFTFCLVAVLAVPSGRIINGSPAARGQFPYQAYVSVTNDRGNFICSGAIISREWVLTAGHCVVGARNATITVGSNSLEGADSSRIVTTASRFVIHDGYDDKAPQNDIALIQLSLTLYWSTNVQPIPISKSGLGNRAVAIVSGWGVTSSKDSKPSPDLRFASLRSISNAQCAQTYGRKLVTSDIICAVSSSGAVKGLCAGDIGGPLVANASSSPILVGIGNFFSSKGCETSEPSGFTRVNYFASWISNVAGI